MKVGSRKNVIFSYSFFLTFLISSTRNAEHDIEWTLKMTTNFFVVLHILNVSCR